MKVTKASKLRKAHMLSEQTTKPPSPATPPPVVGKIEPELQDHIGSQLRALYNEIVNEPVPDRFLELLAELERQQTNKP